MMNHRRYKVWKSCPNRLRLWLKTLATDELATQWAKSVWLYALCHCFGVIDLPSLVFFRSTMPDAYWAHFLSLAQSKLRLYSANHRAGYFSNLAYDWLSIVWAYSKQDTENGPWSRSFWIFTGARLKVNGAPGDIQGNLKALHMVSLGHKLLMYFSASGERVSSA